MHLVSTEPADLAVELARRVAFEGDRGAEAELCKHLAPRIRAYGLLHLRNEDQAAELVQHVLVAVLQALRARKLESVSKLPAWVMGTCRNTVLDWLKGERRRRGLLEQYVETPAAFEEEPGAELDIERLRRCLQALPIRDASVVSLTYLRGRSSEEIGGELGMKPGAIRVARHRALKRLLSCMEGSP